MDIAKQQRQAFIDQCTARLATMVWRWIDGEHDAVAQWLRGMGCTVEAMGDDWQVQGTTGMMVGLTAIDPITAAVSMASCLAGMAWPFAFPGLLKQIQAEWRQRTRARKAQAAGGTLI